ncbi:MAG: hypothetical protein P4L57_06450 [Rhizomicrobium sp.]|nr:hypothetical protein [Rhizomicrobium sp.]
MSQQYTDQTRKVGFWLGLGIFLAPYIFAWFVLRNGYSQTVRTISLGWLGIFAVALIAGQLGKPDQTTQTSSPPSISYVLPAEITVEYGAERGPAGDVYIVGTTNLPNGTTIGAELVDKGRLGGQDFKIHVTNGKFRSEGFTNKGKPLSSGKHTVHVLAYFNGAWQSDDILHIVGDGGRKLNGKVLKLEDPDVVDSDKMIDVTRVVNVPPLSEEATAIALVKGAILTVDGQRSSEDVEATIERFMKFPDLSPAGGWKALRQEGTVYIVNYEFNNGNRGKELATWEVDTTTKKVRYVNKSAKWFSWAPNN